MFRGNFGITSVLFTGYNYHKWLKLIVVKNNFQSQLLIKKKNLRKNIWEIKSEKNL